MAALVDEIMNRELFTVPPSESAADAIGHLIALGISTCPVVASDGTPVGMIGLRDLILAGDDADVGDLMRGPLVEIAGNATIREAAALMGETGYHHLVAVNEGGKAIGMVSSLDVVRGLAGMPASHPEAFPHYERDTGLTWTDDVALELDRVEAAPSGPGVLALVRGGAGVRERVVWSEYAGNVRGRLIDMLADPIGQGPIVRELVESSGIRFRAAQLPDETRGTTVVDALQRLAGHARLPN